MLPSTGLFKSVLCPYYGSSESRCSRPYCHYKHATKKDEEPEPAVYIPTQKIEPPKLLTLGEPLKKKSKLEYIPTKPQINDAPLTKNYSANSDNVPVYIPSNKININLNSIKNIDLDDCTEELEMISEVISAEFSETEDDNLENTKAESSTTKLDNHNVEEKKLLLENIKSDKENKIVSKEKNHKSNGDYSGSFNKDRHRSTSTSSNSRHKKSSKSENDSKEKLSDKDHKTSREKSSKHLSSSSNTKSKSTSSHHSSKSSHKSSTKEKHSSRHKSSSKSSSSSSKRKRSISKEHETKNSAKPELSSIDLKIESSDEEDIEAQCKLIFEQFKPNPNESTTSQQQISNKNTQKRSSSTDIEDASIEDVSKKKRIAHENPNNYAKLKTDIAPSSRPNHMQNAVRSVYDRKEKALKDHEEKKAVALAQYREAQEKLKEATENLLKADTKLTPLVPKSHLLPSKPSFLVKPISNIIALERAKKKVEEMQKQKGPTLAQSAIKGSGRIAHRPPTIPTTITKNILNTNVINNDTKTKEIASRPAPPVLESKSTKISYNIRMQNYNTMVKYCLDIYPICEDAWERAQTEELAVFKKCSTPNIYRSSAIMTINKLRKESIAAGNVCTDKNKTISHELILAGKAAQNVSWGVKKNNPLSNNSTDPFDRLPSSKIYDLIFDLILTEEQLIENGYPRSGKRRGTAIIQGLKTAKPTRNDERFCERCSKIFNLSMYDEDAIDECNYHPKGTGYRRGFVDNFHRCCQQPAGTPGCTYGNYHVSNYIDPDNLTGFVTTIEKDVDYCPSKKDIFALDCEMCYTTHGIELTRITVVDFEGKIIYDALVKPNNKIVDYNTTFSGITEKLLENETRTIRDVQAVLLSMFHSKSILIGHSLESDLKTLKLIHSVVVDTSVLYPHKMGRPKKRALKTLCIENLKRIIQEDESGHNSAEDAEVCIQLVKYYLRNRLL